MPAFPFPSCIRYDSLVQAQARTLPPTTADKGQPQHLVVYQQHVNTMIKAFEELLQASDVDQCVAEGFQEQLHLVRGAAGAAGDAVSQG